MKKKAAMKRRAMKAAAPAAMKAMRVMKKKAAMKAMRVIEEGSHEAPCHEGSSTSGHEGHACDEEEGSHEAPCHEGSSTSAHEGHACDEEEGSHEAPCHEG